jgi:hypothetical protein
MAGLFFWHYSVVYIQHKNKIFVAKNEEIIKVKRKINFSTYVICLAFVKKLNKTLLCLLSHKEPKFFP